MSRLFSFVTVFLLAVQFSYAEKQADFDRDGDVDQSDFGYLQRCLGSSELFCSSADLNEDSVVNSSDTNILLSNFTGPLNCKRQIMRAYFIDRINGDDSNNGLQSVSLEQSNLVLHAFDEEDLNLIDSTEPTIGNFVKVGDVLFVHETDIDFYIQMEVESIIINPFIHAVQGRRFGETSYTLTLPSDVSPVFVGDGPVKSEEQLLIISTSEDLLYEVLEDGSIVPFSFPPTPCGSCETGCQSSCQLSCESGCETFEETPLELYPLFPEIIRETDENSGSILKGVTASLEAEAGDVNHLISELPSLVNIQTVSSRYLSFLSNLLGQPAFSDWSLEKKRIFISSLVSLYKHRGMVRGFRAILNLFGRGDISPVELFKDELYEDFHYRENRLPYELNLRAARIEYVTDDTESMGEEVNINGAIKKLVSITNELTEDQLALLRGFYPIHVREKPYGSESDFEDDFALLSDLQELCESSCETNNQNFTMGGYWIEEMTVPYDNDENIKLTNSACYVSGLEIYLKPYCESKCQSICEAGAGCQAFGCQLFCESHCQLVCQYVCQVGCQGSCENPCMVTTQA